MNRVLRVVLNIFLTLIAFASIVWGIMLHNLQCWFEVPCTAEDIGQWPSFFYIVIPCALIVVLIFLNKKKRT